VAPDGHVPRHRAPGVPKLAAERDCLIVTEPRRVAETPAFAQETEHVDLRPILFPVRVSPRLPLLRLIDFAGDVVLVRRDRDRAIHDAGVERDDGVRIPRTAGGGEALEIRWLRSSVHRVRPIAAVVPPAVDLGA